MSSKGHIHYDNLTECYSDCSDRTVNLVCELSALIELDVTKEWVTVRWKSESMPPELKIPFSDVSYLNVDIDGLMITIPEDSEAGKKIWKERDISAFAA